MADHTALADETQRLKAAAHAAYHAWAIWLSTDNEARTVAAWGRYAAAWQAYLAAVQAEVQEAVEAVAGRTAESGV